MTRSEEGKLVVGGGGAEVGGGEGADVAVEGEFSGEDVEGLGEVVGEGAVAAVAVLGGLVEFSVAGLAEEGFDFSGAVGVDGAFEPVEEEVFDLVGESEEGPGDAACAGFGDGFEEFGEF